MAGFEYFRCLLCGTFYPSLWKVERHVKQHEHDGRSSNEGRRRGMLPIKKTTFISCHIPLVRTETTPKLDGGKTNSESNLFDGLRRPRASRIKAVKRIRQSAQELLKIPEVETREEDEEFIKNKCLGSEDEKSESEDNSDNGHSSTPKSCNLKATRSDKRERKGSNSKKFRRKRRKLTEEEINKYRKPPKTDPDKWLRCEFCSKMWASQSTLSRHLVTAHGNEVKAKTITCFIPTCEQPFFSYSYFRRHLTLHRLSEEKEIRDQAQVTQDDCSENSSETDEETGMQSNSYKYRKRKAHLLKDNYLCKFCLRKFDTIAMMHRHLQKKHKDLLSNISCSYCDKESQTFGITTVKKLIDHTVTSHPTKVNPFGERPYDKKRVEMRKVRKQERLRRQEVAKLEAEQGLKCETCGKVYKSLYTLQKHEKLHEDPDYEKARREDEKLRIYSCPKCDKKYKHKDNLTRHYTIHMDDNPFTCSFPGCGKKLHSSDHLKRHEQLHLEKTENIKCPLCPGTYSEMSSLIKHLRRVHKPSDVTTPRKIITKGNRKKRLTRWSSIPALLPSNNLKEIIVKTEPNTDKDTIIVKKESPDDTINNRIIEEIHLIDKIKLDPDGEAIHIKGESLDPEIRIKPFSSVQLPSRSTSSKGDQVKRVESSSFPTSKSIRSNSRKSGGTAAAEARIRLTVKKLTMKSRRHNNYSRPDKLFTCTECNADFTRAWTLHKHMAGTHKKKIKYEAPQLDKGQKVNLLCGLCAYPAKDAIDLKKHNKIEHSRRFKCPTCHYSFNDQASLASHITEIHNNVKNKKKCECNICGKIFMNRIRLAVHIKKDHPDSLSGEEKMACEICKRLYTPLSLSAHLIRCKDAKKLEKGEKVLRFKCKLCQDEFVDAYVLKRHVQGIHLGKSKRWARKPKGNPTRVQKIEWFTPLLKNMSLTK